MVPKKIGVLNITIDDVEKRFREKLDEMGTGKGAVGERVSEALDK